MAAGHELREVDPLAVLPAVEEVVGHRLACRDQFEGCLSTLLQLLFHGRLDGVEPSGTIDAPGFPDGKDPGHRKIEFGILETLSERA